jgi:hypothetical protein
MTQEEKQIKLAEAAGWSHHTIDDHTYWWHEENNKTLPPEDDGMRSCPDYFNDLNAMYAAEKVLEERRLTHKYELQLGRNGGNNYEWSKIHATAAQRAEALGLTLNLW